MADGFAREQDMRRLRAELDRLWADFKVVREQLQAMGRREGESLFTQARPQVDRLKAEAQELVDRIRSYTGGLEQKARAEPMLALLGAVGLFIVALGLFGRKS